MNKQLQKIIACLYLAAVLIPAVLSFSNTYEVHADGEVLTVELQPDPSSIADTMIQSANATTNYGTDVVLGVGEDNAATNTHSSLLKFDFSTLPSNITIVSATLNLWVKEDHSDHTRTMRAYTLLKDWSETGTNYNENFHEYFSNWETPGANGTADMGDEFGSVSVADTLVDGDQVNIILDLDIFRGLIKNNYYGIKLQMDSESDDLYLFYASDETTETGYRPQLTIEYTEGSTAPIVDWICYDSVTTIAIGLLDCGSLTPGVPQSPNIKINGTDWSHVEYATSAEDHNDVFTGLSAVRLDCDPYPLCKDDYPIYYKIKFSTAWVATGAPLPFLGVRTYITIPGGTRQDFANYICTPGASGTCSNVIYGVIPVTDIGSANNADMDFAVNFTMLTNDGATYNTTFEIEFSLAPLTDNCSNQFVVPVPETYNIDPTIEDPVGDPLDDQVYPTVVDADYMVRVSDGPWTDGTGDRYDAAVSVDGIFWYSLEEYSAFPNVKCVDTDPYNPELFIIYFTATTDEFHIRANDTAGDFEDNANPGSFKYKIGIAFEEANAASCESQFTYDETEDLLTTVEVDSISEDVQATDADTTPLEPGEWYAVTVDSGTWNEPLGTGRIDMEYKFGGGIGSTDWEDLSDVSDLVWCVSSDGNTVFVQAPSNPLIELHLRVNDQDLNFENNTGTLNVNIFHTAFTRIQTGCELQFDLGSLLLHDSVEGNQSAGKSFGKYPSNVDLLTLNGQPVISVYTGDQFLLPGAWYALDTVEGPWLTTTTFGDRTANTPYYDMEIKVGTDDWADLATWDGAQCVVPTDSLGHVRVIFQVPEDATLSDQSYLLRVASNAFMFTRGYEAFDLYAAIDYGYSGATGDCSSYKYDADAPAQIGQVNSALPGGSYISGLGTGSVFAVQIESADAGSGWFESTGSGELDGLQISVNGGSTWDVLPDSPSVLCHFYTPVAGELVFFIRVQNGQQWKLRADSSTFSDNIGFENYTVFEATPGGDINLWTSCIKDYPLASPAINPHQWIPVEKPEGILIASLAQYAEYNGLLAEGAQLPPEIWKDPDASGNYVIEIEYGTGPWDDGETPTQHYDAQLSRDNGVTWETLDADTSIVVCSTVDQLRHYWKALIHVQDGDVWKIRVADSDTGTFADNSGNLAYVLYTAGGFEVPPADNSNIGYISVQGGGDVCQVAPIFPGALDLTDIDALGTYLGDWVQYTNLEVERYMAFCPRHVSMFFTAIDALKKKEPFATLADIETMQDDITRELKSYGWDGQSTDTSFIWGNKDSAEIQTIVERYVSNENGSDNPWADGAPLVGNLTPQALPSSYAACISLLPEYKRFAEGLCFASSMMKETSAQFWIQLSFDVSTFFLVITIILKGVYGVVQMATGVTLA